MLNYRKLWILVSVLGLIDIILTLSALSKGAVEINPVARALIFVFPNYLALTALTLICIFIGVISQYWLDEEYDHIPVLIFLFVWSAPVVWNSWQLGLI